MELLLEEVVFLLGGGAVVMQPEGQTPGWWTIIKSLYTNTATVESGLLTLPGESFRQVAELQTCPLKLRLKKFLAAHELLSQTLHPHRCLHQTLMQSCILLLQCPITDIKQCFHSGFIFRSDLNMKSSCDGKSKAFFKCIIQKN